MQEIGRDFVKDGILSIEEYANTLQLEKLMKEFSYKAKDKQGRSISGRLKAGNRNDALTTLKARKYTKIRAKEPAQKGPNPTKLSPGALLVKCRKKMC